MRFLVIGEKAGFGGAEEIMRQECRILRNHGHEVLLLTYDPSLPAIAERDRVNLKVKLGNIEKGLYRVMRSKKFEDALLLAMESFSPDVIHIHNSVNYYPSVCNCSEAFRQRASGSNPVVVMQTVHDASALCPTGWCADRNGVECVGYKGVECVKCARSLIDLSRIILLPREMKLKRTVFDVLISPSTWLAKKGLRFGLEMQVIRNPEVLSGVIDAAAFGDKERTVFYAGRVSKAKGVPGLIEAWRQVCNSLHDKIASLRIAGPIESDYLHEFERDIMEVPSIEYLGRLGRQDIISEIVNCRAVVIPSLWMENYPTVAIEALQIGTLVVGSNRGGVPEIVGDSELLFDSCDVNDIMRSILKVLSLTEMEYLEELEFQQSAWCHSDSCDRYHLALYDCAVSSRA